MAAQDDSQEILLKLSVKELKLRIASAGGTVPPGPLEKTDLVAALQSSVREGPKQANSATGSGCAAASTAPTDSKEEDLRKLSIGEIKKRLFWAGAALPAGTLEKADLVAALEKALAEAPADVKAKMKGAQIAPQAAQPPPKAPAPKPKKVPKPPTKAGDRVVVLATFLSDGIPRLELRTGIKGVVKIFNSDGSASITFNMPDQSTFDATIWKSSIAKLDTFEGEKVSDDPADKKKREQEEEVFKLHLLSEGQLRKRLIELGADVPAGVGKHYLVAMLKNKLTCPEAKVVALPTTTKMDAALAQAKHGVRCCHIWRKSGFTACEKKTAGTCKWPHLTEAQYEAEKKEIDDAKKKAAEAAKPKQPSAPNPDLDEETLLLIEKENMEEMERLAKEMEHDEQAPPPPVQEDLEEKPEPKKRRPEDDGDDITKFSSGELKRRLCEYGPHLLVGLAEKSEFIAALQKAVASGPPPRKEPVLPAAPPAPVALDEEQLRAQMEEMEKMSADARSADPEPPQQPAAEVATAKTNIAAPIDTGDAKRKAKKARKEAKRKRQRPVPGEVTISDDDDVACIQKAVPVSIDGDVASVDVEQASAKRPKVAAAVAEHSSRVAAPSLPVPIPPVQPPASKEVDKTAAAPEESDSGEDMDTWL